MKYRAIAAALAVLAASASAAAGDRVRIAVLGLFHPDRLVVEAGRSQPIVVNAGEREFVAGEGECRRVFVTRSGQNLVVRCGGVRAVTKQIRFTARQGKAGEFILSVPGKLRRLYRGELGITVQGRELAPVVEMDLETAVASVVAAELPGNTPLETLKAQAVVSRSYLVAGGPRHAHADFCDTTHCQFLRRPPEAGSAAARAAAATRGLVLAWRGKPFAAMYSASCGGRTHSLAEAGYAERDYPYFGVKCPYCRRSPQGAGGHGIGLCQRGASGMARAGRDFRAILDHYFPNTTIESLPSQ